MRALWLLALAACHGPPTREEPPPPPPGPTGNAHIQSFRDAKQVLRQLYGEEPHETVYEGCPFARGKIDWSRCCYTPRDEQRRRLEWEHVVPAARFGGELPAWRQGDARCVSSRGKRYKGRSCARVASAEFNRMEGDLHNLLPSVGAVNAARGHFPLGLVDGEPRDFGSCDFEVGGGRAEPRPAARGELARAYLYMAAAYPAHVTLDDAERRLYEEWHRADPPDAWEKERNARIAEKQGNRNPFID